MHCFIETMVLKDLLCSLGTTWGLPLDYLKTTSDRLETICEEMFLGREVREAAKVMGGGR